MLLIVNKSEMDRKIGWQFACASCGQFIEDDANYCTDAHQNIYCWDCAPDKDIDHPVCARNV